MIIDAEDLGDFPYRRLTRNPNSGFIISKRLHKLIVSSINLVFFKHFSSKDMFMRVGYYINIDYYLFAL